MHHALAEVKYDVPKLPRSMPPTTPRSATGRTVEPQLGAQGVDLRLRRPLAQNYRGHLTGATPRTADQHRRAQQTDREDGQPPGYEGEYAHDCAGQRMAIGARSKLSVEFCGTPVTVALVITRLGSAKSGRPLHRR